MQQFYYLAVLFVAGGIGSALIVAADLRTRRQPMRIMESVWVLTALWASFFGLWAYFAFGRAARHMPVQNNGTGKQKGSAKISEPAKGGGIGENGNERKVGSAGQEETKSPERTDGAEAGPEAANGKPGTGGRKDLSVAGTDPWKVSEPERAMNMPEPAMTGMQMENGTTTGADGAEDMPGMKGTAVKTGIRQMRRAYRE
ncbi:MAG: PLD nuclease N-terminal domain-containing protein [Alistipes onderdonkii]